MIKDPLLSHKHPLSLPEHRVPQIIFPATETKQTGVIRCAWGIVYECTEGVAAAHPNSAAALYWSLSQNEAFLAKRFLYVHKKRKT